MSNEPAHATRLYPGNASKELRQQAARELPVQLYRLAEHHGLAVSRVSVRNQRSRWGSCSPTGHICLNWRLVLMPEAVRDYVLIHELMHLRRLDHSRHFWRLVAHACPDYQNARRWLREHRHLLDLGCLSSHHGRSGIRMLPISNSEDHSTQPTSGRWSDPYVCSSCR